MLFKKDEFSEAIQLRAIEKAKERRKARGVKRLSNWRRGAYFGGRA